MPKTGVEPEWFINTRLHVYIAWFEYMHARHLIGTHDRHLAFMQAWCNDSIHGLKLESKAIEYIPSNTRYKIDYISNCQE